MLRKNLFILFVLVMSYTSYGQTIDSKNSKVTFNVSNMAFNSVEGSFTGMTGEVNYNPDDLSASSFEVCVDAASVDTDNEKRDNHLKNKDFFEVEKYPEICFSSNQIVKTKSGFKTTGILTMHGVSKTIEIPFTFKNNQLIGDFKVKRLDYKVGVGTSNFMVGKEIKLKITCTLN